MTTNDLTQRAAALLAAADDALTDYDGAAMTGAQSPRVILNCDQLSAIAALIRELLDRLTHAQAVQDALFNANESLRVRVAEIESHSVPLSKDGQTVWIEGWGDVVLCYRDKCAERALAAYGDYQELKPTPFQGRTTRRNED